ncbi:hypothetical protein GNX71_15490 [Variovorax sp. RKNM96]|nr:hypothetical protein GNX71_15490 [Variovorax sp. RKNM96]
MEIAETIQHYEERTCSRQWLAFNRGMAAELSAGLPPEDLHQLFFRIGRRVADALPVTPCDTLDDLQTQFNARWDGIDWGFSNLREEADCVVITHACSPMAMAFGPEATSWSTGFFEGVYQAWFDAQRMPPSLRVRALEGNAPTGPVIELRLGRTSP